MDGNGPQQSLSDAQLDRELDAALGIEPSPEFHARVRTRVAAEPETSRWRLAGVVSGFSRSGRPWTVEPLWGVAIVGIMLAVVVPQMMREQAPASSIGAKNTVAAPVTTSNAPRVDPLEVAAPADITQPAVVRRAVATPIETPLRLSPVLFSEDERQALIALVGAVEQGRVPPLPAATQVTDQRGELHELRIEPLVIEPLPLLARLEEVGASQ